MATPNGRFSKKSPWPKPGNVYNHLTVISRGYNDKHGHQRFWCRCDCGKLRLIRGDYLQNGRITSCGHVSRGIPIKKPVKGYRCVETGEVFATSKEALASIGLTTADFQKLRSAASRKHPDYTLGVHPETGEPLHWERVDTIQEIVHKIRRSKRKKRVILLNTQEVFRSLTDAHYRYPQADLTAMSRCCNGERNSAGKDEYGDPLVWMWYEDWSMEFN